jgi:hypothetical protein
MTQPAGAERISGVEHVAPAARRARYLSAGQYLGAVAAVFVALYAATMILPHDPYIRYQSFKGTIFDRLTWVYERLVYDPTPIDVLVVGSSRTARGVNMAEIEAALAARGKTLHVANVSIPASGFDWRLTAVREALAHHPEIKLVIWELVEVFPREGHQAFGDLATPSQILTAPWLVNTTLPKNLAALPYRQIELALASRMPGIFGYHTAFDPAQYAGTTPDHRKFNDPAWTLEAEIEQLDRLDHALTVSKDSAQRRTEITWPVMPAALAGVEFGVSRHYVDELVVLSKQHHFDIAFLFLPFFGGYPDALEAEWVGERGAYWNADFLLSDPANYIDAAHPSQTGIQKITPWLAGHIADLLPPAAGTAPTGAPQ